MIRRVLPALAVCSLLATAQAEKIQSAPPEAESTPTVSKKLPNKLEPPAPEEAPKRTPDEIVATFFETLKADRVDAAYDTLKNEFAMADRGAEQSKAMREQTQKALDAYGPVIDYEKVKEEKLGDRLVRRSYLLIGSVLPLRWKFYFYKPSDRWMLIDLRIDDAIADWFEDSAKPAK